MRRLQVTWRVPARGMHILSQNQREVCRFRHTILIQERVYKGNCVYCRTVQCKPVEIPKSVHMIVATKGEMSRILQRIAECRLRVVANNMVRTIEYSLGIQMLFI